MPRKPVVFSDEDKIKIEALAAYLSREQVADYFGISRTTFYEIEKRDPSVTEHYKRGRSKAIQEVAQSLIMKARDGDNTCMVFYLKTQAGWKENPDPTPEPEKENNFNFTFNVAKPESDIKVTTGEDEH